MKNKSLKIAILKMLKEKSDSEIASALKELREDALSSLDYYYAGEGDVGVHDKKYFKILENLIDSQLIALGSLNKKHLTQLLYLNKIYKNYPKDLKYENPKTKVITYEIWRRGKLIAKLDELTHLSKEKALNLFSNFRDIDIDKCKIEKIGRSSYNLIDKKSGKSLMEIIESEE